MPEVKATHRYLRTSPFKVREVLDLVRGLPVEEARQVLTFHSRGSAREVLKVLNSAVANAEHNSHIPGEELFVSKCFADEGITLKRWRPRARGRATRIRKRTSHVTVIVDRMTADMLAAQRAREETKTSSRASRVAASRKAEDQQSKRAKQEIDEVEQELNKVKDTAEAGAAPAAEGSEGTSETSASSATKGGAEEGDAGSAEASGDAEADSGDGDPAAETADEVSTSTADEPPAAEETAEDEAASGAEGAGPENAGAPTAQDNDKYAK